MNVLVISNLDCPICGCRHWVEVDEQEFEAWRGGMPIQKAMPKLGATQREQLISQICPGCQRDIFGE